MAKHGLSFVFLPGFLLTSGQARDVARFKGILDRGRSPTDGDAMVKQIRREAWDQLTPQQQRKELAEKCIHVVGPGKTDPFPDITGFDDERDTWQHSFSMSFPRPVHGQF